MVNNCNDVKHDKKLMVTGLIFLAVLLVLVMYVSICLFQRENRFRDYYDGYSLAVTGTIDDGTELDT